LKMNILDMNYYALAEVLERVDICGLLSISEHCEPLAAIVSKRISYIGQQTSALKFQCKERVSSLPPFAGSGCSLHRKCENPLHTNPLVVELCPGNSSCSQYVNILGTFMRRISLYCKFYIKYLSIDEWCNCRNSGILSLAPSLLDTSELRNLCETWFPRLEHLVINGNNIMLPCLVRNPTCLMFPASWYEEQPIEEKTLTEIAALIESNGPRADMTLSLPHGMHDNRALGKLMRVVQPRLRHIIAPHPGYFFNVFLEAIIGQHTFPKMKKFEIGHDRGLLQCHLRRILSAFPSLEYLSFSSTAEAICALSEDALKGLSTFEWTEAGRRYDEQYSAKFIDTFGEWRQSVNIVSARSQHGTNEALRPVVLNMLNSKLITGLALRYNDVYEYGVPQSMLAFNLFPNLKYFKMCTDAKRTCHRKVTGYGWKSVIDRRIANGLLQLLVFPLSQYNGNRNLIEEVAWLIDSCKGIILIEIVPASTPLSILRDINPSSLYNPDQRWKGNVPLDYSENKSVHCLAMWCK
jgi:hypothetical protein